MKKLLFIAVILCCTTTFAQAPKLKKADALFEEMAYVDAAKAYEAYLESAKKPGATTTKRIADTYYFTNKFAKAAEWYQKVLKLPGGSTDEIHYRRYVLSLRALQRYDEADVIIGQKLSSKKNKADFERFKKQKRQLDSIIKFPAKVQTRNITEINTSLTEFGTTFFWDKIIYSSARDTTKFGGKTYKYNNQPYLELYVADVDSNGTFSNEKKFAKRDQISYHNSNVAFLPGSDSIIYFSANILKGGGRLNKNDTGTNNIGIFKAKLEQGRMRYIEPMPFNNVNYSCAHPAISVDGKWMYFTSDMPGGQGETDIYIAEILANGLTDKPKNLGPIINTEGKEMFPFIIENVLYFSSDWHYGLGGLDVFQSAIDDKGNFAEPQNLGKPVNSNRDDFAYIIAEDKLSGYFSSNRDGGKGDDDIYYFEAACEQAIAGVITNKTTAKPIEGVTVTALKEGAGITKTITSVDGKYAFTQLPCNTQVTIIAEKPNHVTATQLITLPTIAGSTPFNIELTDYSSLVTKQDSIEKITINPIFFDFDKYDITPQAALELDKVVYVLQNFPNVIIKIESHTDARGDDDYNLTLSNNRAKATYGYILSQGIQPSRIESVTGYGETRHMNQCSNGVECSEEEHLKNRRSEFIVVRK
jgi:outer membrane protein OmpA-like peptidoglycan-associated protein/tetratricopeptide (TPR) repeat protein